MNSKNTYLLSALVGYSGMGVDDVDLMPISDAYAGGSDIMVAQLDDKDISVRATTTSLNDTGISTCSDANQSGLPCPVTGFPRQDAEYGTNGFNFTKLDTNGNILPATATNHVCVRDNVTGLIWEVKTDDGGLRDKDLTYTLAGATQFVAAVNATGLCGYRDWRMPTPAELVGIVDYSRLSFGPALDTDYFPNTLATSYITSRLFQCYFGSNTVCADYIDFCDYDTDCSAYGGDMLAVRLVRGSPSVASFRDNGNSTVTDSSTGLMWAKCNEGLSGVNCATGNATWMNWGTALTASQNSRLGNYSNWRLPNVKELQSLVDYNRYPAINSDYFPNSSIHVWTSSYSNFSLHSWSISFHYGFAYDYYRNDSHTVRLVRNTLTPTPATPSAITNVPSIITSFSDRLSGIIIPNGAVTTATFEFGLTTNYGTSIVATPSTIAAVALNTTISANKIGLTCATNYHYRVKAVNRIGTSYGANQSFTTAACPITAPTAVTNPATNATANSVKLNGTVTSNGSTTNATFDFGTNTNYGTSIAAGTLNSNTPVIVTATRIGLTCNTIYHYRIKATNIAGTGLGLDKSFVTSACPQVSSWLNPQNQTIIRNQPFTLSIIVNSSNLKVGAYSFIVTLDAAKLGLNTAYQNASNECIKGICPGTNALGNRAVIVNARGSNITLVGNDNVGVGPGNTLQLLIIHFKTKLITGTTPLTLTTSVLDTPEGGNIGLLARGATVKVSYGLCGDSDGNDTVNIVDALSIARTLVNLPPPPTVDVTLADTNENGRLDINDALFIARYSVGLVLPPEACNIGVAL